MALIDNLESYSTGDLNGQGSWSGDTTFDIQTTTKYSGTRAVQCNNETHTWYQIAKSFDFAEVTGSQIWYVYFSMNGGTSGDEYTQTWLNLVDGATSFGGIRVGGGYIQLHYNSEITAPGYTNLVTNPDINTWYKLEVGWNGDQIRGRVNDGTWSDWYYSTDITEIDGLQIAARQSNSFFDDFNRAGSFSPSISPSQSSSISPSASPSISPSISPSFSASLSPSISPSYSPSISPSQSPSASLSPSLSPSLSASLSPSISPSASTSTSLSPSLSPSFSPSISPSFSPSLSPSLSQSLSPSVSPSISPSISPSFSPSISPSKSPSLSPSISQSLSPSISPSPSPTLITWSWASKNSSTWDWQDQRGL